MKKILSFAWMVSLCLFMASAGTVNNETREGLTHSSEYTADDEPAALPFKGSVNPANGSTVSSFSTIVLTLTDAFMADCDLALENPVTVRNSKNEVVESTSYLAYGTGTDQIEIHVNGTFAADTYTLTLQGGAITNPAIADPIVLTYTLEPAEESTLDIVTISPEAGSTMEHAPEAFIMTFNEPEKVGYAKWNLVCVETEEVLFTGQLAKTGDLSGSFKAAFKLGSDDYSETVRMYEGYSYSLNIYVYGSEEETYSEMSYGSGAFKVLSRTYQGATKAYVYAKAKLDYVSLPDQSVIANVAMGQITAYFTDPVETFYAEKIGENFSANTPLEVTSNEEKTAWTFVIPEKALSQAVGTVNVNFYAADADGRRVNAGDKGEEESHWSYSYGCFLGSPEFTISPADNDTVESLSTIVASYKGGINLAYYTQEPIRVLKGQQVIQEFPADSVVFDEDHLTATITLANEITAEGVYTVLYPTGFFSIGEEFSAYTTKEQSASYIILGKGGASAFRYVATPAEGEVETLTLITVNFPDLTEAGVGSGKVVIKKDGEEIATADMQYGIAYNDLDLYYTAETPGVYTFEIPEGYVLDQNGNGQPGFTLTYTVTKGGSSSGGNGGEEEETPCPEFTLTTDPADGSTLDLLNKIVLTFDEGSLADVNYNSNAPKNPVVVTTATGDFVSDFGTVSWGEKENQLVVEIMPLTNAGEYTITIVKKSLLFNNQLVTEDVVLHYTITGANGIQEMTVGSAAADGKRMENGSIVIRRNGRVYNTAGQIIK